MFLVGTTDHIVHPFWWIFRNFLQNYPLLVAAYSVHGQPLCHMDAHAGQRFHHHKPCSRRWKIALLGAGNEDSEVVIRNSREISKPLNYLYHCHIFGVPSLFMFTGAYILAKWGSRRGLSGSAHNHDEHKENQATLNKYTYIFYTEIYVLA